MKRVKLLFALIGLISLVGCDSSASSSSEGTSSQNTISESSISEDNGGSEMRVLYFSCTGNTERIASYISEVTSSELVEIVPEVVYTEDDLNYSNDSCRANVEQQDSTSRPGIANTIENIDDYSIYFLGFPIWWGIEPRIIDTLLDTYDFSGKTIIPFATSGGSGITSATNNIRELESGANVLDGRRFSSSASLNDVQSWIDTINL